MKVYDDISGRLAEFITRQPMFFVATAPLAADKHVNVSPKGMLGTFKILSPRRVAYLDYHGSGAETISHLRENRRITIMFCAFEGSPNIVRLYGTGRVLPLPDPEFTALLPLFTDSPDTHGARSIIDVDVHRITDSCGFSVPLMSYEGDRDLLLRNHARRSDEDFIEYRQQKNAKSIDGLPAYPVEETV